MEQIHHCQTGRDPKREMSGEDYMRRKKISTENKQTTKNEVSPGISNEASHSMARIQTIPPLRLQSAKSFPPYSEHRGGEDLVKEWDFISQCSSPRYDEEGEKQPLERKSTNREFDRFANANRRAKWGRWEKLGTSYDGDSWRREYSDIKDDDSEQEGQLGERDVEEAGEWRQRRELNLSQDIRRDDSVERRSPESTLRQEPSKNEEDEEPPEKTESSSTHQHPVPHPILSKFLHSTSSPTSSSTLGLSSADSEEVFSDKEDAVSKRTTFRKVRTRGITFKMRPQTAFAVDAVLLFCEVDCSFNINHSDEFEKEI